GLRMTPPKPARKTARSPGPLGELVAELARHSEPLEPARQALRRYFHDTASRIDLERQLQQSLRQVPENAGPLNSGNLMHKAIALMQETSPQYTRHFMAYVDALAWLEQASALPPGTGPKK